MKITKANVQDRYVVITNDFAQNKNMSLEAKGMLLLMASRPSDWVFHKSELMKECGIGRDKINRIFKELESSGNLCVTQSYDANGKFSSNEYILFVDSHDNPTFIPSTEKQQPFTDLPLTGEPYTANQPLQKKDINKVNINTKRFTPPSLEEVRKYCIERGNGIDAQKFIDYYSTSGWKRGNTKIKDWKACVRTWESKNNNKPSRPREFKQ